MITTLTGSNGFLLKAELAKLTAAFLAAHGEFGLERVDGEETEFDVMQESLQSLPFLADKKLVVLRAPSANKIFAEKVEQTLGNVPETTDVIIVEPKLDKRLAYYKYLKKNTEFKEFIELDANGLARWLTEEAKAGKGSLSLTDARFLVDRVGANQQSLGHELEKLLLYEPNVSRKTIELLTEQTPQSTVFELLESAFAGNLTRTQALYKEQRTQKVEPQQIIAMLAWQLHIVALIKTAEQRSPEAIAKEAKVSPYVVKKSQGIARKLSLPHLRKLINDLLTIDRRLKRESLDADEMLQNYLLQLAQ